MSDRQRTLRAAIIGCGRVADRHVAAIKQLSYVQLAGVADVNEQNARRFAKEHGIGNVHRSMDDLLNSTRVDVVHVLTPPSLHYEYAKAALERGASVFVEKPVVFTTRDATELYDLAAAKQVCLCPDFGELFQQQMLQAQKLIASGKLGRVVHVESHMRLSPQILDMPELREARGLHWSYNLPGGLLHNYITHPLYIALYFTGRLLDIQIQGKSFGILAQDVLDHLALQVVGENCTASVLVSLSGLPAQDARIYCERGSIYVNFDSRTMLVDYPGSLPRLVNRALSNLFLAKQLTLQCVRNNLAFVTRRMPAYPGVDVLVSRFYESILQSAPAPISPQLTLDVVRIEEEVAARAGRLHLDTTDRTGGHQQPLREEKVLVTGAAGYLGLNVVEQLVAAGYYVRAFVRPTNHIKRLEHLGVELIFGDIRSFDDLSRAMQGMDIVVQVAAAVRGREDFMLHTAVDGTHNLAKAARLHNLQRVIYISSMSIYDYSRLRDGEVITENSPLEEQPELRGTYTLAKRRAEDIALSHLHDAAPAWTILRPSVVVGDGRDVFAPAGKRMGGVLLCFAGPRKRLRLIHVKDVAAAVVNVLQNGNTQNQVFTLSQPPLTLREYVNGCIERKFSPKVRVIYIPYVIARLGGQVSALVGRLAGRGSRLHLNSRVLSYMYRNLGVDTASLGRQTGWHPRPELLEIVGKP